MDTKVLEKIGLTKNEAKIYLALLEIGQSTAGLIAKKAELHPSRVYESIERLLDKGLVSYVIKANRKHYEAAPPETFLNYLEKKKSDLEGFIPQMKSLMNLSDEKPKVEVYEGYKGVKSVYDNIIKYLKKGDEILVLGAGGHEDNILAKTYFKHYTTRRVAKGISNRILFIESASSVAKEYLKTKLTKVKLMPHGITAISSVDIYGDCVATLLLSKEPIVILIRSKEIADSYRSYFELMWKIGSLVK